MLNMSINKLSLNEEICSYASSITVHVCPYKGQTGLFHWQEHDNRDLTHLEMVVITFLLYSS